MFFPKLQLITYNHYHVLQKYAEKQVWVYLFITHTIVYFIKICFIIVESLAVYEVIISINFWLWYISLIAFEYMLKKYITIGISLWGYYLMSPHVLSIIGQPHILKPCDYAIHTLLLSRIHKGEGRWRKKKWREPMYWWGKNNKKS